MCWAPFPPQQLALKRDVVFGQVVRHTEGCVARCIVVMESPGLCDGWADADDAFRSRSRTDRECSFLMEVLERLRKRIVRPAIAKSWRLYHDNAPSHTAFRVTDHLAKQTGAHVIMCPGFVSGQKRVQKLFSLFVVAMDTFCGTFHSLPLVFVCKLPRGAPGGHLVETEDFDKIFCTVK